MREFWAQTEAPAPDYEADWGTLNRLYTDVEVDSELEADDEMVRLAREYDKYSKEKTAAEKKQKIIKAQIQERIGNAAKVFGDGIKISRTAIKPSTVTYERRGYVQMRVTVKGEA